MTSDRFLNSLQSIRRDLAHAIRSLAKERAFTFVCVVSLGIGLGAVVALSTFSRAILSPARGIDTNGLTEILILPEGPLRAKAGEWALERWSYPDYQALRAADTGMAITAWTMEFSDVGERPADGATPPRVATLYVSPNYFSTMGIALARGSGFDSPNDDTPVGEARVVVTDNFWRSRLASDPDVIGTTVILDGVPHVVVGITPPDFHGHFHFFQSPGSLVFVPLERHPRLRADANLRGDRTADWLRLYGRLQPGVDRARANGLVAAAMAGLAQQFPATNQFKGATVEPYASMGAAGRPESVRVIGVLVGLATVVLLIVCLNISGMMLVRGTRREREICIRAALGADRRRLIQHLLFEAVLLAFVGGAISGFVLFGIPAIAGWYLQAPVPQEIDLDATGVAIAVSLCLVVSLLFGLLPALRFSRPNLAPALKDDVGGGGRQTIRVHRIAAMVQIGIAMPFLVIAGVMLDRVRTADLGFPTDGLAAARLPARAAGDRDAAAAIRRVRDGLRQVNGVRSVAIAEGMPVDFDYRLFRVGNADGAKYVTSQVTRVGENFLETIGAPLMSGRTITAEDGVADAAVAVISTPLADQLFPDRDAIGERVKVALEESHEQEFTVVGVTADFATSQLTTERPQILLPMRDSFAGAAASEETPQQTMFLIVRGAPGSEAQLKGALENVLRELGVEPQPGVAFEGIVTGADLVEKSLGDLVAESTAVAFAGGVVLVLAALGIVGVIGFMVATRTRELAMRMALGASRLRVFGLILRDTAKLVIPGVAGGLLLAAVLIRTMDNVMGTPLSVGPTRLGAMEPLIYAAASAIAIGVALLAGFPSARRATSVQPLAAIRAE
ncbi:MAG TPA: ABC transporter permease [Vicinamibacterales bacterium]|nr:ABC transporter permease [Vicinamibacterales bacterium]